MTLEPLAGLRVVDLYAGSGALGIEALSRGAARVDFVESDRIARLALEANLETLALGNSARVWALTLPRGLSRIAGALRQADVVFMDPPYGGGTAIETLAGLGAPGVLHDGTRVIVEHHAKDAWPEASGHAGRVRTRRYGETVVSTYRVSSTATTMEREEGRNGH